MFKVHSLVTAPELDIQDIYCGLIPGFETWGKVNRHQRRAIKRLLKGNDEQRKLADLFGNCRRAARCGSGGCRRCLKKAREQLIPQVSRLLLKTLKRSQKRARKGGRALPKLWAVSAADARQAVPRGSLGTGAVERKTEAVSKAIERSALGRSVVFACLDVSLNFLLPKGSDPVWQPHYYFLMLATSEREIHSVLDPHFQPEPGRRSVPVKVEEVDPMHIAICVSYGFKSEFMRRESYKGKNKRTQTAKNRLLADEKDELSLFLDKLGIGSRLLLRGLKIIKGRVVRTRLRPQHNSAKAAKPVTTKLQRHFASISAEPDGEMATTLRSRTAAKSHPLPPS